MRLRAANCPLPGRCDTPQQICVQAQLFDEAHDIKFFSYVVLRIVNHYVQVLHPAA